MSEMTDLLCERLQRKKQAAAVLVQRFLDKIVHIFMHKVETEDYITVGKVHSPPLIHSTHSLLRYSLSSAKSTLLSLQKR